MAPLAPQPADAVTTFALIHGAWDRVAWAGVPDELWRMGHEAVAPDLSCDEPGATFDDDAAIVLGALEDVRGDDVVVVGFSLGDHTAALVAAARPVRELVYLAAMVPEPGVSLSHQFGHGDRMLLREYAAGVEGPDEGGSAGGSTSTRTTATSCHDCPEPVARERFERSRELPGSHSPMASRPEELTRLLVAGVSKDGSHGEAS
ncbi:MAG: hypothetical protein WKF41_01410 [Gaiellaceae bacterium]